MPFFSALKTVRRWLSKSPLISIEHCLLRLNNPKTQMSPNTLGHICICKDVYSKARTSFHGPKRLFIGPDGFHRQGCLFKGLDVYSKAWTYIQRLGRLFISLDLFHRQGFLFIVPDVYSKAWTSYLRLGIFFIRHTSYVYLRPFFP